jgi:DNA-binding NarL/FixJ family response regulator
MSTRPRSANRRDLRRDNRSSQKPVKRVLAAGGRSLPLRLTERERAVLIRLAQGRTNRQIAIVLKVSPRTIEKHVERILAKLGATNRTVAALIAARANGQ